MTFFPGALSGVVERCFAHFDWSRPEFVVVAATVPSGVTYVVDACLAHSIPYLYNPGPSLAGPSSAEIARAVRGASILLANETEIRVIADATGLDDTAWDETDLLLAVTFGRKGCRLRRRGEHVFVAAAPVSGRIEPTEAGDAFCAGLLAGSLAGLPLRTIGRLGAVAAVFAVEEQGPTRHHYTWSDLLHRCQVVYGELDV